MSFNHRRKTSLGGVTFVNKKIKNLIEEIIIIIKCQRHWIRHQCAKNASHDALCDTLMDERNEEPLLIMPIKTRNPKPYTEFHMETN